ncbi:MAG: HAD-IC family P-type ATPase [Aliarcobacter sp.]|nr:HAD-IC family P-type ATPase [Aliarcobacter sp.]
MLFLWLLIINLLDIIINDIIKMEAKEIINELKKLDISKTYMLTGDKKEVVLDVGNKLGIDVIRYELLPQEKLTYFEQIKKETNQIIAFIGDGINDAPILANADVSFAMGSDLAVKSADIILLNDNIQSIFNSMRILRYYKTVIKINIISKNNR